MFLTSKYILLKESSRRPYSAINLFIPMYKLMPNRKEIIGNCNFLEFMIENGSYDRKPQTFFEKILGGGYIFPFVSIYQRNKLKN